MTKYTTNKYHDTLIFLSVTKTKLMKV